MISIVIPVHNRKEYTRQCLACLTAQTYRNFQIIVVDDGSTDGTDTMIQEEYPEVVLLKGDGNLWWTEATNCGIRYAQQHEDHQQVNFILTLNDDTRVNPNYLQTMLDAYDQYQPCLVGSISVDSDNPNKLEYAGTTFELYTASGRHLAEDYKYDYRELIRQTDHVESHSLPGRGTLIPMQVFNRIGLFDSKNYIHYMADIEFSVRARKAGYRLIVNAASLVYEYVAATGIQVEKKITLKQFIDGFTSIKSPTNLTVRYNFAIAHSKTKVLYFCFDIGRICAGFVLRKVRLMKPL
ncbi:glycosyltransferase family 2 protein [Spirosoma utsteinense]|uniref:GT2 family glycosyltransferase n=1 Tax=Spirosoma utsteinense TaxID=2585773 RepID=A0ABR6W8U1_9BACT|nr:glycosyltransferase family 2 protein [Spirosoma utsteinense]MBC3787717.1 GT2 family glycosyltransferase [Spirosoma utsteinense]MBC3792679.1 GT2 family glycosyltransferase [Spirosoma utsteinense]